MMEQRFQLTWQGDAIRALVTQGIIAGLNEFHLDVEREAKRNLQPGRGVITGTARRSIHAASPSYSWGGDDVSPTPGTPERGGTGGLPEAQEDMVIGTIGSGLVYARSLHDGHGSFQGYHYITLAYAREQPHLPDKLQKHTKKLGLT